MSASFLRITHQNKGGSVKSLLLDKLDRSQGNFSGYAQRRKQKIYVPGRNPLNPSVLGYIDLVPTDEVGLALGLENGVIKNLAAQNYISVSVVTSSQLVKPIITAVSTDSTIITLSGMMFTSQSPDLTYVYVRNSSGTTVKLHPTDFNSNDGSSIIFNVSKVASLGSYGPGWKFQVFANSKLSDLITIL